jgi:hypothetical protein
LLALDSQPIQIRCGIWYMSLVVGSGSWYANL